MSNPKHIIHTERLDLVPFVHAHEDGLFAMNSDPEVMRYLGPIQTRAGTKAMIARVQQRWQTYGYSWWSILLKGTDTVIGSACLQNVGHVEDAPLEIGWRLMTAYHGKGYASEAGRAAMKFGFEAVGVDCLVAVADPDNHASAKVMQRLGMSYIGIQRHYDEDCLTYEIRRP